MEPLTNVIYLRCYDWCFAVNDSANGQIKLVVMLINSTKKLSIYSR